MTQFQPAIFPSSEMISGNIKALQTDTLAHLDAVGAFDDFVKARYLHLWAYFVSHPDLIQEFLIKRAKSFHKDPVLKRASITYTSENVFVSDGEVWKTQRKLMQPAFHSQRIGAYADAMVAQTRRHIANWQDQSTIDIKASMSEITMRIIVDTMFHAEIGDDIHKFAEIVNDIFLQAGEKAVNVLLPVPMWLPTEKNRRWKDNLAWLRTFYQRMIDDWRKEGIDRGDLLSMLMAARYEDGQAMSDPQIMSELHTIFAAGHETTATTLLFAFTSLSDHPEVMAKVRDEVQRVLGDRSATLADLHELTYTSQVIKETLRLYPAAIGARRLAIEDTEIGGYPIKKGSFVTALFWNVHRNEAWYADPKRFNPERWTPEFEETLPRYAYVPFGAGPRVCIGNQFALMEAQLVLATIVQSFDLKLQDDITISPTFQFTLHPGVDEVPMTVTQFQTEHA